MRGRAQHTACFPRNICQRLVSKGGGSWLCDPEMGITDFCRLYETRCYHGLAAWACDSLVRVRCCIYTLEPDFPPVRRARPWTVERPRVAAMAIGAFEHQARI